MNPRVWNLKWIAGLAGLAAVAVGATVLTLALLDGGKHEATAQEGPTPTQQATVEGSPTPTPEAGQTALPTAGPSATETPSTTATPQPGEACSPGWTLHDYPDAGYSVCIPPGWVVLDFSGKAAEGTFVKIFDPDLAPYAGRPAGAILPGSVNMGIRVASASQPYNRSGLDNPTNCSTHTVEEISGKQVDVCMAYATDSRLLPADRFLPGEEKGVIWVFPSVDGVTLVVGAGFDSPVSAEDDSAVAAIVRSIRQ